MQEQFLFSPYLAGSAQGADEVVGLLVKAGMYDRAVILTRAFGLKLNPVFESLALRWVLRWLKMAVMSWIV